jgi:hypothetical protein
MRPVIKRLTEAELQRYGVGRHSSVTPKESEKRQNFYVNLAKKNSNF